MDKVLECEPLDFKTFMKLVLSAIGEWTEGRTYNPSFPTPPTPFHVVLHCSADQEMFVLQKLADAGVRMFDVISLCANDVSKF